MLPPMTREHETWMRLAISEAELARGATGDNPWVGCVIVSQQGALIGRGHTLGPGEDHGQLGPWVLEQHPHEPLRRAQTMPAPERLARLAEIYGVDDCRIEAFLVKHLLSEDGRLVLSDVTLPNSRLQPAAAGALMGPPRLKRKR